MRYLRVSLKKKKKKQELNIELTRFAIELKFIKVYKLTIL
jgi:hypothetical protein